MGCHRVRFGSGVFLVLVGAWHAKQVGCGANWLAVSISVFCQHKRIEGRAVPLDRPELMVSHLHTPYLTYSYYCHIPLSFPIPSQHGKRTTASAGMWCGVLWCGVTICNGLELTHHIHID